MRRCRWIVLLGVSVSLVATIALAQERKQAPALRRDPTPAVTGGVLVPMQRAEPPKGGDKEKEDDKAVDPNFAPLLQQFTQQFRPILRAEFHLVRSVCGLNQDQLRKIHAAGESALKEAATKSAESQVKMMRGIPASPMPDGRKSIQAAISTAVKTHASAEQAARYEAELEERGENQKRVAVRNSVALLDEELCLSADQREKIEDAMSGHWNDSWLQTIEMLQYGRQFLPPIPDQCILPFLNDAQKAVWQGNRETRNQFFGGMFFGGVALDDDALEAAAPHPAPPPPAAPPPAEPPPAEPPPAAPPPAEPPATVPAPPAMP